MSRFVHDMYWVCLGIWATLLVVIALEARREEGGSMPLAMPIGVLWFVGGLLVFLLAHVLICKVWPEKEKHE